MSDERKSNGSLGTISDMSDLPDIPDSGQFVSTKSSHPSAKRRENIVFMGSIEPLGESKDFLSGVNDVRDRGLQLLSDPSKKIIIDGKTIVDVGSQDIARLEKAVMIYKSVAVEKPLTPKSIKTFSQQGGIFNVLSREQLKERLDTGHYKLLAIEENREVVAFVTCMLPPKGTELPIQRTEGELKIFSNTIFDASHFGKIPDADTRAQIVENMHSIVWIEDVVIRPDQRGQKRFQSAIELFNQYVTSEHSSSTVISEVWKIANKGRPNRSPNIPSSKALLTMGIGDFATIPIRQITDSEGNTYLLEASLFSWDATEKKQDRRVA